MSRASKDEVQEHRWTLDILRQTFDLNLVIDLTATDRYYNPVNVNHVKIKTKGHVVPDRNVIDRFFIEVDKVVKGNQDALIGVHCTHGINRTGYLICRYLIEKLGWDPERAIREFRECRGHPIERQNYLQSLRSLKPKLDIEEDFENLDLV